MSQTSQFLIRHGLPLVFAAVFVDQAGLPLPALPWLLAAGALSATGQFSFPIGVAVTVLACLMADASWFYLGRHRGNQVLGALCRISLEPDSCVRRTQNLFTRYGLRGLLVAKFLPGWSTVAPPMAGMSGMSTSQFLSVDAAGSLLYGGCFLGLGYLFSRQLEQIGAVITRLGGSALALLAGLAAFYIAYKYWQRRRLLHELRTARITVDELRKKLDAGEKPVIFDLRSSTELAQDPSVILGAIHLGLDEIEKRHGEFSHDRDIIVYCSCPNEVTSARVALSLQRKGFTRVRPLLGGINAWRTKSYPTEVWPAAVTTAAGRATVDTEPSSANAKASRALVGSVMPGSGSRKESEHDTREPQA